MTKDQEMVRQMIEREERLKHRTFTNKVKSTATEKPWELQRVENLAILGAQRVMELCVGSAFTNLTSYYSKFGIMATGNDIDTVFCEKRNLRWQIGDAIKVANRFIARSSYDTFVFAPPIYKKGHTERKNALAIDWIQPSYDDFLTILEDHPKMIERIVLVLPFRALSTPWDRAQYYKLLAKLPRPYEVIFPKTKLKETIEIYMEGTPNIVTHRATTRHIKTVPNTSVNWNDVFEQSILHISSDSLP